MRNDNDELVASYEYNGLNQRVKKVVGNVVTTSFFNENWQELESVTVGVVTTYVWGLRYVDDLICRECPCPNSVRLAENAGRNAETGEKINEGIDNNCNKKEETPE